MNIASFIPEKYKKTLKITLAIFLSTIILDSFFSALELPNKYYQIAHKTFVIILIATVTWLLTRAVLIAETLLSEKYRTTDNLQASVVYTKINILRQITIFLILVTGAALILMTFDPVRELGISILASAGVAGLVITFSAQRTLASIIAGLQIAITQPIKIDDAVIVENEFGNIEEITLTYVVVKLWDFRRLVVPVSYFLEKPFQNWTRNSTELIGTVNLYLDYAVPVEEIRTEFTKILNQSKLWNEKLGLLSISDFKENHVVLRILASASNAGMSWDLCCEIREKLLAYIKEHYPESLPKMRILMS